MFELTEMTEAMLASVTNRTEVHGDERKPAVTMGFELTLANTVLDSIDPTLREALYKALPDSTPELPGIPVSTPVLRCNTIDRVTLPTTYNGWLLAVDDGIDDTKPMTFGGCKVDKFSVDARQGGSVVLRLRVGTSDIDAERLGKLGMHNGQAVWVTLTKPEAVPDAIDGSTEAFKRDHPDAAGDDGPSLFDELGADQATDRFLNVHTRSDDLPDDDADELDEVSDAEGLDAHGEGEPTKPTRTMPATKPRNAAAYRNDATGETWSGRGLKPRWLTQALEDGASLSDFAVAADPARGRRTASAIE